MASSGCIVRVPWRDIPAERYGNHRTISVGSIRKAGFGNGYRLMQQADAVGKI